METFFRQDTVAYFSMEIALDPRMPTYSGGLEAIFGRPSDGRVSGPDANMETEFWFGGDSRSGGLEFHGAIISFCNGCKIDGVFRPLWYEEHESLFRRTLRKLRF